LASLAISDAIEALKTRARILVSVLDIEPMARSGRVSEKIGQLLIRLKFKPLVSISPEGKGTIKGIAFSVDKNRKILLKTLRRQQIGDYVIVHADAQDRADALKDELVRMTGREPLYITDISAVVALFAGRGSVAVAWLEQEKKDGTR
jgi:fatty acid-binding protein DegV